MRGRAALATLVGLGVGGGFLYLFARDLDTAAVAAALRQADLRFLALAVASQGALYLVKALRWGMLLPAPLPSFRDRWDAAALGFGANCLLPGRMGEALRVGAIHKLGGTPVGQGISSLVLERLADVTALAFYLGLGAATLGVREGPLASARTAGGVAAAVALAAFPVLGWIGRHPTFLPALAARVGGWVSDALGKRLEGFAGTLAAGLAVVGSPGTLAKVAAASLVHWAACVASIWFAARALGVPVDPAGAAVVLGATAFAVALPQAPGYLGPYQWAVSETTRILGAPAAEADAFAILVWAVSTGFSVAIGGAAFLVRGRGVVAEASAGPQDGDRVS